MKICFIDESGCNGALPSANSPIQPALIVGAIIVDFQNLRLLTERFLQLKQKFYPKKHAEQYLSGILREIKGSEVRKRVCSANRNDRRHCLGYLGGGLRIVEDTSCKVVGRIWVKGPGQPFDGRSVYTSSVQRIFGYFQEYLRQNNDVGIVIADSRLKSLNSQVAHSIFTQKFKSSGDVYDRIVELPTFAHSDNHAGLQLADLLWSGVVWPMTIVSYCSGHIANVHVKPEYAQIKAAFSARVRALQFRYKEGSGKWQGGIVTSDAISQRNGAQLFV